MGPSTGVSLTPPRRRRERTSSTRFRVATSMRWKFIVLTRRCRVCSLLRFDGKKWCFSRLSDSSSPLPFPDRSFFDRFKRSASIQMTGPSHAACKHWAWSTLPVRSLSRCSLPLACRTAVKVFYSTVATAQLAVHTKDRVEWGSWQFDPPATFSLPDSVSKPAVVDKRRSLHEESEALRARPEWGVCTPQNQFLTVGSKKHRRRQR